MKKINSSVVLKIVFVLILVGITCFIITRPKKTEQQRFQQEYDKLVDKYPDLDLPSDPLDADSSIPVIDDLWSCEDDMATLYCFFEQEPDVTFEEAKDAFQHLESVYSEYCHY